MFSSRVTGTMYHPDADTRIHRKILKDAGIKPIWFHDFRHSCATIMLYLGYSLKDIQTWLGHSNYNFTADTYIHSAPAAHQKMAAALGERLPQLQENISFQNVSG